MPVARVSTPPATAFGWTVAAVDPASARLRLRWTESPDRDCGQAGAVQVMETDRRVVIGFVGTRVAGLVERTQTVTLRRPLGTRALLQAVLPQALAGAPPAERRSWVRHADELPGPNCVADTVPAGFVAARTRLAPDRPTSAVICRVSRDTAGNGVITSRTVGARDAVLLASTLNASATRYRTNRESSTTRDLSRGPLDAVVFRCPGGPGGIRALVGNPGANGRPDCPITPASGDGYRTLVRCRRAGAG